jgi:hypothetical protein
MKVNFDSLGFYFQRKAYRFSDYSRIYLRRVINVLTRYSVLVQRKLENIQAGEVNKMAC